MSTRDVVRSLERSSQQAGVLKSRRDSLVKRLLRLLGGGRHCGGLIKCASGGI